MVRLKRSSKNFSWSILDYFDPLEDTIVFLVWFMLVAFKFISHLYSVRFEKPKSKTEN